MSGIGRPYWLHFGWPRVPALIALTPEDAVVARLADWKRRKTPLLRGRQILSIAHDERAEFDRRRMWHFSRGPLRERRRIGRRSASARSTSTPESIMRMFEVESVQRREQRHHAMTVGLRRARSIRECVCPGGSPHRGSPEATIMLSSAVSIRLTNEASVGPDCASAPGYVLR